MNALLVVDTDEILNVKLNLRIHYIFSLNEVSRDYHCMLCKLQNRNIKIQLHIST